MLKPVHSLGNFSGTCDSTWWSVTTSPEANRFCVPAHWDTMLQMIMNALVVSRVMSDIFLYCFPAGHSVFKG